MIVSRKIKRIKIKVKTPITKPCNGAVRSGKINNLLLLGNGGGEEGKKYLIKGLRGLLNHSMMSVAKQRGMEVCHSSDKIETQSGEKLLPIEFHPNGSCYPENECIRHKLMGSIKKQSILRFEPVVVISENLKGNIDGAQKMHIATEKRNSLVYGTKRAIQDFGDRYVSGKFTMIIEFLKDLTKEELRFLLQSILYMPELGLGGSVNSGSGKLKLEEIILQEVKRSRTIGKNGKVIEKEKARNLWREMEEALEAC